MDAVQKAGSGHPGTAMSLAPAAYVLFQRVLRHDPADADWIGRDRFVLSCGHSSLTLYIQLYLSGYGLTLGDLEQLRTWGSRTPGHPERHHTPGIEVTTGPLGQGLANAVGMAMAARRVRGLMDPDAPAGTSPFDHHVYVFASDGDIEEGITHEASALAGHQKLGNLIVLYDDNDISIEDDTAIAKSEDVCARYEAYGWHVQRVSFRQAGGYHEDVQALHRALLAARDHTQAPSFIALSTIIGWPAPNKQNTGAAHGSALGADEVAATKKILHFDPAVSFPVEQDVVDHARDVADRGKRAHAQWDEQFARWAAAQPERKALLDRLSRARAARRVGLCAAGLRARREGRGHPQGVRCGAERARPGAPRALGRVGRPRREQRHHDGGRAVVHPAGAPDQDVPRQHLRPHAALRHPRAHDGRGPERDRRRRPDPAVRRHVPGVQRLHARGGPAGGAVQAPVDLHLDARLHRPRRRRPDPPAGRAPVGAARHSRP